MLARPSDQVGAGRSAHQTPDGETVLTGQLEGAPAGRASGSLSLGQTRTGAGVFGVRATQDRFAEAGNRDFRPAERCADLSTS
jgi:hypothetical protein